MVILFSFLQSMHNWKMPYFFLTNITGAPHGDTFGLIQFLSSNSYNFIFISVSSITLIQQGDFEIGEDPSIKLIVKLIPLFGGRPKISLGNPKIPSRLQSHLKWACYILLHCISVVMQTFFIPFVHTLSAIRLKSTLPQLALVFL